jgi:hypothetical protein
MRYVNKSNNAGIKPRDEPVIGRLTSARKIKSVLTRISRELMMMADAQSRMESYRIRNMILTELEIFNPASTINEKAGAGTKE